MKGTLQLFLDKYGEYILSLEDDNPKARINVPSFSADTLEKTSDMFGRIFPEFIYEELRHREQQGESCPFYVR